MQSLYGFDRKNWLWATALMLGALLYSPEAEATSLGKRRASVVLPAIEQASMLVPVAPALTPLGFTRFCFAYPEQCNPGKPILRPKPRLAVRAMIQDLDTINRRINRRIRPVADQAGLINDLWTIGPVMGDCDDYAVYQASRADQGRMVAAVAAAGSGRDTQRRLAFGLGRSHAVRRLRPG